MAACSLCHDRILLYDDKILLYYDCSLLYDVPVSLYYYLIHLRIEITILWLHREGLLVYIKLSYCFASIDTTSKIVISILIFTFYIIKLICIIIKYLTRLVFRVFSIKAYLTEVSEQPRRGTPALNVKAIREVTQTSVNKERYWLTLILLHPTAWPRSHDW